MITTTRLACASLLAIIVLVVAVFLVLPIVLACITVLLQQVRRLRRLAQQDTTKLKNKHDYDGWFDGTVATSLYAGRVWHCRYRPIQHAFTYPLFLFCLDLDECENGQFNRHLWPLSILLRFRESDHLKNGEGTVIVGNNNNNNNDSNNQTAAAATKTNDDKDAHQQQQQPRLSDRIRQLVAKRTKQAFCPTQESHRILLVTHLSYYGYCFNPVSFYYLQERRPRRNLDEKEEEVQTTTTTTTTATDAVVAEVSNTPWNEMHAYVLHQQSVDQVTVDVTTTRDGNNDNETTSTHASAVVVTHYSFPKAFHVSPFMEMEYMYHWTFHELAPDQISSSNKLHIVTDMRVQSDKKDDNNALQFRARVQLERKGLHPLFCLAGYLTLYPVYCALIQLWIHWQALWLFLVKGVAFQPHPARTETTASRLVGTLMTPLVAMQEKMTKKKK
jgi:uncharacterized protein